MDPLFCPDTSMGSKVPKTEGSTTKPLLQQKRWICDICHKSFSRSWNLSRHIQTIHTQIKLYWCQYCKTPFRYKYNVKSHEKLHTHVNRYMCEICMTSAKSECALREHKRTHSADKPFKCESCKKNFKYKRGLQRHTKKCHKKAKGTDTTKNHISKKENLEWI